MRLLTLLLVLACVPIASWGQEAPATDPLPAVAAPPQNRLIEEIVVTAQKREENLQDVPISVSAFSLGALDARGIDDPKALAQSIPGVYYGQIVNFAVIYIRGVGSDAFLPDSDPSVASYIDGVYLPLANGLSQSFGAVERIEVLKGPQGTLFGRNSTGGAINIITKSPGDDLEASTLVSYGRFKQLRSRIYLSAPLGKYTGLSLLESIALSFSGTYNDEDSYYEGSTDRGMKDLVGDSSKGGRLKLRWAPLESLELKLAGIIYETDGLSSTAMPNVRPFPAGMLAGIQGESRDYVVNVDAPAFFTLDNDVVYGTLLWSPAWFDVKVLGSRQEVQTANFFDFDGSPRPVASFFAPDQFADVWTGELQILSKQGGLGFEWLDWMGGIYYIDQESGFPQNYLTVQDLDLSDGTLFGAPLPPGFADLIATIPGAPNGFQIVLTSLLGTKSLSGFSQATAHFRDWIHLTLGGRYSTEERFVIASNSSFQNADGSRTLIREWSRPTANTSNFAPKVVLGFNLIENTLLYGSWTRGFKSATFNTVNIYDDVDFVKPERVTTIEVGLKTELLDGGLRFNAAGFENKIDDLQVQVVSLLNGGAVSLENAGEARVRGAEFDVQWSPLPRLDPGLVLTANGAYLDGVYLSYPNGSGFDDQSGVFFGRTSAAAEGRDFSGNEITRTPRYSGLVAFNQLVPFGDHEVELGASAYYNDGFFYLAQNSDLSRQESYYVVDAQLGYHYAPWNVRLTAFGKNINDARYRYYQFILDFGRLDYLAPPATWGVRFSWEF